MKEKKVLTRAEKKIGFKRAQERNERNRKKEKESNLVIKKEGIKSGVGANGEFILKNACQKIGPDIFAELVSILKKPGRLSGVRLRAIEQLLDRGFGKPTEKIDLEVHKILLE